MTKIKGILLTEGMHGMISQVEGLAKAMDIDFTHHTVELNNFWKLLPPKMTPVSQKVFKKIITEDFDLIISCGRKSVIPSIYLKKNSLKKIVNIHIQNPKVNLNNFNYVIAPEHDGLLGTNVFSTKGAIHYLSNNELDNNENYLKTRVNKKKIVTLIVGGPNRYYDYKKETLEEIFFKIKNNFLNQGYQLIFITSMRTPQIIIDKAKNYFDKNQIVIENVDKKAYLSSLKLANHIVVTCDSTSMISEAAMTGKPIYIAQMPTIKKNNRFKIFFKLFETLNITKNLENSVDNWSYEKLNESDKISSYIKEKFKNYDFS